MKLQLGQESMKSLADCPLVNAASLGEREQRAFRRSIAAVPMFHVALETQRQIRAQRYDSAFAKLGFPDEEQVTSEIDVGQPQPNDFAYSEPQTIEQSEDRLINKTSIPCH
jgi:hypothetical protein